METRIEIYKDSLWQPLRLQNEKAIKYNALINRVGKVESREISHTNTFSIPSIYHNINILGLNLFNPRDMAQAMNAKYEARYYIHDKLVQQGYVVINNTNGGDIKINFIDEALDLVDKWGSTTFQELLQSDILEFPADYDTAINEIRDFDLSVNSVVTRTNEVGSRGYRLCLFPNTLNTIGEKFQLDINEDRQDDVFNPYQSRPLWNVKSLFDLATETYGFTPIYDDSVNWDEVANTFIISDGLDKNKKGESGTQSVTYNSISSNNPYYIDSNILGFSKKTLFTYGSQQSLRPDDIPNWVDPSSLIGSNGTTPWMSKNTVFVPQVETSNSGTLHFTANYPVSGLEQYLFITLWKNPVDGDDILDQSYFPLQTAHPKITLNSTGADVDMIVDKTIFDEVPAIPSGSNLHTGGWTGTDWSYSSGNDTVSKSVSNDETFSTGVSGVNTIGDKLVVEFTIDSYTSGDLFISVGGSTPEQITIFNVAGQIIKKTLTQPSTSAIFQFSGSFEGTIGNIELHKGTPATELIGTMTSYGRSATATPGGNMTQLTVAETFLPEGVVAFDKYGQYLPNVLDLDFAAPNKSIKDLLSAAMHQQGILMNIDSKNKEVKFFNYGEYEQQKINGNYSDWSSYLLEYNKLVYNTDYGNGFGKRNRIGLSSPFPGNTFDVSLDNGGLDSKYKDFNQDEVRLFKDVQNVVDVQNTTAANQYFEYEHHGLGLVEGNGTIGPIDQERVDGTLQGQLPLVDHVENVNYASLPDGVKYWYRIVDEAVRVECQMLLPVDIFRNLDISEPVYVEKLNGFYIVEEIKGYQDAQTPVTVKLIKLIDNIQGEASSTPSSVVPAISLTAFGQQQSFFNMYKIVSNTSFVNYTPTAATVTITKMTDHPNSGGTETTTTETAAVPIASPYTGASNEFLSSNPIQTSEIGWYKVQVQDDNDAALVSNVVYAYRGDQTPVTPPSVSAYVDQINNNGTPTGTADIVWSYNDFTGSGGLPTTATLSWRKKDYFSGTYLGNLRTTSWNTSSTNGTTNHDFIDGAGFYELTLTTNEATSSTPLLGGYFVL